MKMKSYLEYFWYVLKHKWFVFLECIKIGLIWRGIKHDCDKFLPSEFFPYAKFFYGTNKQDPRDKTGYYKPYNTGDSDFNYALLKHLRKNDHHWEYYVLCQGEDGIITFEMPSKQIKEMICDWKGANRAQKKSGIVPWYLANKDKLILHPDTRKIIEIYLGIK